MPPAVTWVATWVASYFGGSALVAWAVEAAIYYAAGRFFYNKARQDLAPGQIPLNSHLQYLNEPDAPHRIIYGEAELAPTIVADYSDDEKLVLLAALTPHALEEIVDVKVNDHDFFSEAEIEAFNNTANKVIIPRRSSATDGISELRKEVNDKALNANRSIMAVYLDRSAANPGTLETLPTAATDSASIEADLWPPAFGRDADGTTASAAGMKMSGMVWVVMIFPRSNRVTNPNDRNPDVWNRIPTLSFRVRRANSTLKVPEGFDISGYSRGNAALCAYDYLARYTDYANPICGIDRIDASNLTAAAQFCEARGLTCNGVVGLDQAPADVMEQLGFAMNAGVFTEVAGIRKILPGAPSTAVRTITDDEIKEGSWAYSPLTDVNSRVSEVVCRYNDADGIERSVGASYPEAPFSSSQEIQLDLVNSRAQAQAVARIMLSRIWNGAAFNFSLLDPETPIAPYDKVIVKGGGPLGLDETFRILAVERTTEGLLNVQCIFEADDLFDEVDEDASVYIPPSRPPNYTGTPTGETYRILIGSTTDRILGRGPDDTEDHFITYR